MPQLRSEDRLCDQLARCTSSYGKGKEKLESIEKPATIAENEKILSKDERTIRDKRVHDKQRLASYLYSFSRS